MSDLGLGWAAGFIEGEGCFTYSHTPTIEVVQKQKEPLIWAQVITGCGKIRRKGDYWLWQICSSDAIAVIEAIFNLLSKRRQGQATAVLDKWYSKPHYPPSFCRNGHDKDIVGRVNGNRCKECSRRAQREWAQKHRR